MSSANPNRQMPYPYTLGAQIRQFPFRFFWRNQPVYRMMIYGWLFSLPLIWKIHNAVNSPSYKEKYWADWRDMWAEYKSHYGHVQHEADHEYFAAKEGHHHGKKH